MKREVKKLTWFERNILCMKVEIHHENYQAYVERNAIQDTQQLILHRLSGAQTAEPTPTLATSYASWNTDRNWCDMEQHLFAPPDAPTRGEEEEFEEEEIEEADEAMDDDPADSDDSDDWEE
jgi:hypothetical protein